MTRNTITIECDEREEAEQLFDWLTEYPFNSHEAALSEYLELALGVISANKKMLWTGEDAARQALTDYKESIR